MLFYPRILLRNFFLQTISALIAIIAVTAHFTAAHAAETPPSFADLVQKLSPAVVNISTTQKVRTGGGVPFMFEMPQGQIPPEFREFFDRFNDQLGAGAGRPVEREVTSLGSGFVIDASGYIVTNNHVIAEAEKIRVIFSDNSKYDAKIIGRDAKTDLALLKIDAGKALPFVSFGDSDQVRVGDWVVAIGNPFGLGGTVTAGIISARGRSINAGPFDDFLQTDAAINRGNSGGPMFNVKGEVIGINTAIFSPNGANIGIGFAVPSALAKPIIDQLRQFGRTHRGWLGVKIQEVTDEVANSLGLKKAQGALVLEVAPESPAGKAGIEAGDVILSFDGKPVEQMRHLPRLVAESKNGARVKVEVWRKGQPKTVNLTVAELDESKETQEAKSDASEENSAPADKNAVVLGLEFAPLTPELRQRLKLSKEVRGAVVVGVDATGIGAKRGFRRGDVITQVNDAPVANARDVRAAMAEAKRSGREFALWRVLRRGEFQFIALPTDEKSTREE